jgi:hypothetical protein
MVVCFELECSQEDVASSVGWAGMPRAAAGIARVAAGIARELAGIARAAAGIARVVAELPRPTLAQWDQEADMLEVFAGLVLVLMHLILFLLF